MDFETTLIRIYLFVTERFAGRLYALAQRQSNNSALVFTDAEVLTIYLFGAIRGRRTVAVIHAYTADHFVDWFPRLPGYAGFVHRLGRPHRDVPRSSGLKRIPLKRIPFK